MEMSKPLSYQSTMCVIQYLEPNARFRVGFGIPSFGAIEKRIPLKLEYLGFTSLSMKVNDHEYKLRVLKNIQDRNKEGDCYDYDDFGKIDRASAYTVLPGDVVIEENERETGKKDDSDVVPKQEMFLQFTESVSNIVQKKTHLPYKIKLHEAMKNLSTQLLGERKGYIEARKLEIGELETSIIRLPVGLKLKIQELAIEKEVLKTVEAFQPILEKSSFPLKLMELRYEVSPEDEGFYQHRIISTADNLKIDFLWSLDSEISLLKNRRVHIATQVFLRGTFMMFIQSWLEDGREIGTWYSFGVQKYSVRVHELFATLDRIENAVKKTIVGMGCVMYPQCVTLPMNHYSKLVIFVEENANYNEEMAEQSERPWVLNMKVMDI